MNNKIKFSAGVLFLAMAACATTRLTSVWIDPGYQRGSIKTGMIMALSNNESSRKFFEDEFVRELEARGITATQSYKIFPELKGKTKEYFIEGIKPQNFDAVLVTRVIEKKDVNIQVSGNQAYTPYSFSENMFGNFERNFDHTYTPDYNLEEQVVVLETNVYDAKTEKVIYKATSETMLGDGQKTTIKHFIQETIKSFQVK